MPTAGMPTIRTDTGRPGVPPGRCKADIESLGDETSAKAIINPSIFTNYGLNHRDFFLVKFLQIYYLTKQISIFLA